MRTEAMSPQYEPSAQDMPVNYIAAQEYIGCPAIAYGPPEITFWPLPISMVAEAKECSVNTRTIHIPSSIRLPVRESQAGMPVFFETAAPPPRVRLSFCFFEQYRIADCI